MLKKMVNRSLLVLIGAPVIALLSGCDTSKTSLRDVDAASILIQPDHLILRPNEVENVEWHRYFNLEENLLVVNESSDPVNPAAVVIDQLSTPCPNNEPKCVAARVSAHSTIPLISDRYSVDTGSTNDNPNISLPNAGYIVNDGHYSLAHATPLQANGAKLVATTNEGSTLAVTSDNHIYAWGTAPRPSDGNLVRIKGIGKPQPIRINMGDIPTGTVIADLKADPEYDQNLILDTSGKVWVWGQRVLGLMDQFGKSGTVPRPKQVLGLPDIRSIDIKNGVALALDGQGNLWSWGIMKANINWASESALGYYVDQNGFPTDTDVHQDNETKMPFVISELAFSTIEKFALGYRSAIAIDSNSNYWEWGRKKIVFNAYYKGATPQLVPTSISNQIGTVGNILKIVMGRYSAAALNQNKDVVYWGSKNYNTAACSTVSNVNYLSPDDKELIDNSGLTCLPTLLSGVSNIRDISLATDPLAYITELEALMLITESGSVYGVGRNTNGLIDPVQPHDAILEPTLIRNLPRTSALSISKTHALAIATDEICGQGGRAYAWGSNMNGELGVGRTGYENRPVPVITLGDNATCENTIGNRIIIYKSGTGNGRIESNIEGLQCSPRMCWQSILPGAELSLTAIPDSQSVLGEWRWDCADAGSSNTYTALMQTTKHCKVLFEKSGPDQSILLRIDNFGADIQDVSKGYECPSYLAYCHFQYQWEETADLKIVYSQFEEYEWFGCDQVTASHGCLVEFDNKSRKVGFTWNSNEDRLLTTRVLGNGAVQANAYDWDNYCRDSCSLAARPESYITLVAIADEGSVFVGWSGDGECASASTETTITFLMPSQNINCTAEFESSTTNYPVINLTISGGPGAGQVDSSEMPIPLFTCTNSSGTTTNCDPGSYASGSEVILMATPFAPHSRFTWTGCDIIESQRCLLVMNSDKQVGILFE